MVSMSEHILPELNRKGEALYPCYFTEYEQKINQCCFAISYYVLKDLGFIRKRGDSFSWDELIREHGIAETGYYILKQMLFILEEEGVLRYRDGTYTVTEVVDPESPSETLVALTRSFPEEGAAFQWLARAYAGIPAVLTGKVYAEDVLFPWGSIELVEDVYFSSRVYGFFPLMTETAVRLLMDNCFSGNITVLEVGAGTGNGTDKVLKQVKNRCSRYLFTDVMRSMLKKARKKYADFSFMEYKLYDLNLNPDVQGLEWESCDLIIAVNALHATCNCRQSVVFLKKLLKKGGYIILSEIGPPRESVYRYMELTFGLLSSYFSYEDKEERPLAPIIRPEQWARILREEGFSDVMAAPSGDVPVFDRGGVVLGRK